MKYFYETPHAVQTSDVALEAGGTRFPVHSQILTFQSRVLGSMLSELGEGAADGDRVLHLSESAEEVELMLMQIYGVTLQKKNEVRRIDIAFVLILLADKYEIPALFKNCNKVLVAEAGNMHLGGIHAPGADVKVVSKPIEEKMMWDIAKWLVATKRVDMQVLNKKLKNVLMKILLKASEHKQDGKFPELDKCRECLVAQGGLTVDSLIDVFFAFIKWPQCQGVMQDYGTFEKILNGDSG
ncbi:hypothetical protein BSKO_09853 [Bryopsis sp. KO-2023]|nr:hypothetical protein BSKO_09853 [Bryopsis sp. KO-2023]